MAEGRTRSKLPAVTDNPSLSAGSEAGWARKTAPTCRDSRSDQTPQLLAGRDGDCPEYTSSGWRMVRPDSSNLNLFICLFIERNRLLCCLFWCLYWRRAFHNNWFPEGDLKKSRFYLVLSGKKTEKAQEKWVEIQADSCLVRTGGPEVQTSTSVLRDHDGGRVVYLTDVYPATNSSILSWSLKSSDLLWLIQTGVRVLVWLRVII